MKKIVLTMVALLTMTAAVAQSENGERKAPKQMTPAEMTSRMAKDLKLTDEQKAQVQALNEQYKDYLGGPAMGGRRPPKPDGQTGASQQQEQQRPQRPQMTEAQKAQMKQHKAKREEYDKKLKTILTSEQYKTYQKHQKRHGHRGPRGPRGDRQQ